MFSVVIPAHNEGTVIERCLSAILDGLGESEYEIIVVCNGCIDDTADKAKRFESVTVIELDVASKVAALNAGIRASSGFPKAFVDADVELQGGDLLKALRYLETPGVEIVAPRLHVDMAGSSLPVQCFYSVWTRLPYFTEGQMVGSGVFILSRAGCARLTEFPQLIADDGYVRALFKRGERRTATDCCFRIFAPRSMRDLIKIKTRVRLGNIELKLKYPHLSIGNENTRGALAALLMGRPWLIGAAMVYICIQWQTKRAASQRVAIADFSTWERDESSRQ